MIIKAAELAKELTTPKLPGDPLIITPLPDLKDLAESGAASLDIRLGCWFLSCRTIHAGLLDVYEERENAPNEAKIAKSHYVPFGESFVLHPGAFVLGVSLEWIRLPGNRAAYVIGRSSWGRHGLIIATATGVHPGFTGCLTLEMTNVGEVPITVKPGTQICQLFVHQAGSASDESRDFVNPSEFIGRRKPILGTIELDDWARKLSRRI
ncbi:MAG: dCTP deaminase [Candidatus Brocadiia bacterium]